MDALELYKSDAQAFIKQASGPENHKLAEAAGLFIAEKLREHSWFRQVITPRPITRNELKQDVEHDQLIFIDEVEAPTPAAKAINFRAEPDAKYVTTKRYAIPIFEISTPVMAIKELQLLASNQPVTKVLEENMVREIEEVEDTFGMKYADAAATSAGNVATVSGTGQRITKTAVKTLINLIESKRLRCSTLVMGTTLFNSLLELDSTDLGHQLLDEVTVSGYTRATFLGRKLIVSVKDDMFVDGSGNPTMYGFADEKALGRFLVLDSTKFGVSKKMQTLEFSAWEYIGVGFGNVRGCARISLAA